MAQKSPPYGAEPEIKHKASQIAGQARTTAATAIDTGLHKAAGELGSVAQALRTTSEQLKDKGPVQGYVEKAAQQVDRASHYVERASLDQIVHQVENFARREPALFLGGSLVVGMLGARFLKSSSRQAQGFEDSSVGYSPGPTAGEYWASTSAGYTAGGSEAVSAVGEEPLQRSSSPSFGSSGGKGTGSV